MTRKKNPFKKAIDPKFIDLTGKRFGRWVVQGYLGYINGRTRFLCLCDCGITKSVSGMYLRSGESTSCGCFQIECIKGNDYNVTHGYSKKRGEEGKIYRAWRSMKTRCLCKTNKFYKNYGGRGITICEEWLNSYVVFRTWALRNGFSKNLSLDRENNNGNYEPNNCRWITMKEQARNKRNNILLTRGKETKTIQEWAEITGIKWWNLRFRIKAGWNVEKILTFPAKRGRNKWN